MQAKMFEVRDRGTFIPVMAIKLRPTNEQERYLLGRAGYSPNPETQANYVVLINLNGVTFKATYDQHAWGSARTIREAHKHIIENFDELESGTVIDIEFLLGETQMPKVSEAATD